MLQDQEAAVLCLAASRLALVSGTQFYCLLLRIWTNTTSVWHLMGVGYKNGLIQTWSDTGQRVLALTGHAEFVWDMVFTSDAILVSGSGDGSLRTWNVLTGECMYVHSGLGGINVLALSPSGQVALVCDTFKVKVLSSSGPNSRLITTITLEDPLSTSGVRFLQNERNASGESLLVATEEGYIFKFIV